MPISAHLDPLYRVLVQWQCRLSRGARVGTAAAVPEPFVTAGLRFPLALLSSSDTVTPAPGAHTICSHSSRSCPQTARGAALLAGAGAAPCRHSRDVPGWELAPTEGAGDCGQAGCHKGRRGWKHYCHGQGMHQRPPMPQHTQPGCAMSPGNSGQGDRPGRDPRVPLQPPCTTRSRSRCHTHPPQDPIPCEGLTLWPPQHDHSPPHAPSLGSSRSLRHSPAPPRRHHLSAAAAAALTAANELQAAIWVIYSPKVTASNCSSAHRPRRGVRALGSRGQGERHVLNPLPWLSPRVTPRAP